jgi:hypothetical protein
MEEALGRTLNGVRPSKFYRLLQAPTGLKSYCIYGEAKK